MGEYIPGLVSVIIPTYKRATMLERAIDSVLNQTYSDIELLIVNDNVKGDQFSIELYALLDSIDDERIRLVEQDAHINGAAARNAGIKQAKGEFLAFLDDDDYWDCHKIEHQICAFNHLDSTWGAVGCMSIHIKNNSVLFVSLPHKDGYIFNEVMQRSIGLGMGSLLMKRIAVDNKGYFDEKLMRHQDLQFFGYFCSGYKVKLLKEYLYYIDHSDASNRPSVDVIKGVKEDYYASVKPLIASMSKKEKNKFYIMHNFEIGMSEWKCGKKTLGLKKMLRVFRYPQTLVVSLERIRKRYFGKLFKSYYLNKYKVRNTSC